MGEPGLAGRPHWHGTAYSGAAVMGRLAGLVCGAHISCTVNHGAELQSLPAVKYRSFFRRDIFNTQSPRIILLRETTAGISERQCSARGLSAPRSLLESCPSLTWPVVRRRKSQRFESTSPFPAKQPTQKHHLMVAALSAPSSLNSRGTRGRCVGDNFKSRLQ